MYSIQASNIVQHISKHIIRLHCLNYLMSYFLRKTIIMILEFWKRHMHDKEWHNVGSLSTQNCNNITANTFFGFCDCYIDWRREFILACTQLRIKFYFALSGVSGVQTKNVFFYITIGHANIYQLNFQRLLPNRSL